MTFELRTPRESLREQLRDDLRTMTEVVRGGPWDGRAVVPVESMEEVLGRPLPPVSENGAEVRTPARVVAYAHCPECGEPSAIGLTVTAELLVDDDGATVRLKGKSKGVSHVCGQKNLGLGEPAFEIGDVLGGSES